MPKKKKPDPKFTKGERVRYDIFLATVESYEFDREENEWLYTLESFELDPNTPPQPKDEVGYLSSHQERLEFIKTARYDSDDAWESELRRL